MQFRRWIEQGGQSSGRSDGAQGTSRD
jgi:hypothetical protein